MSITKIPDQTLDIQPVGTLTHNEIVDAGSQSGEYCQRVQRADTQCLQLDLTEETGTEIITDGGFASACGVNWNCGGSWTIGSGVASIDVVSGNHTLSQIINPTENVLYKVVLTVSGYVTGDLDLGIAETEVPIGITANGTFTVYTKAGNTGATILLTASGLTEMDIDDVSVKAMCTVGYRIKDYDTDVLEYEEETGLDVTYSPNVAKAVLCPDWTQVATDKCVFFEIFDFGETSTNLLLNGTFDSGASWTLGLGWNISGGTLNIDSTVTAGDGTGSFGSLLSNLKAGKIYELTFTATNVVGNIDIEGRRTDFSPTPILFSITANGTQTVELDLTAETLDSDRLILREDDSGAHAIDLDNMTLTIKSTSISASHTSQCINIATTWDNSLLLTWTNEDNFTVSSTQLLDYINFSTFIQEFRVIGRLWKPFYEKEKTAYTFSNGKRKILRSLTVKIQRIGLAPQPEYVFDGLSIGLEHDTVTVDGTEFIHEDDELIPEWPDRNLLGIVEFTMTKDLQDKNNPNC